MDCNKEEAYRAKALAEIKMRNNDFSGAQKLVVKAQRLFSSLESLQQMLAVCDVHVSSESKINGLQNWYGILQVMHFSDDATIKKHYRKLALLLHPDKNRFPGAESAFKLVCEASKLLGDKEKRSQYDIKHRIYSRQLNATNSGQQCAAADNASDSIVNPVTFWTCCEHCGFRYKYMKKFVNALLYCSSCQKSYKAYDTGLSGVPPKSSTGQKEAQNHGPCNTSLPKNVESTGVDTGNTAVEVDKKGTVKGNLSKKNRGGESKNAEVRKPKVEDGSGKTDADLSNKGEGKMTNKSERTEPEIGASKPVDDESVSRGDQPTSMRKVKNKRKIIEEPIESNKKRKSSRKSQQNSYAEETSSDHSVVPPTKRSRSSVGLKSERTIKKEKLGVGSSKRLDAGGTSASSCVHKGKAKKNADSGFQERSSSKDKGSGECEASGEGVFMARKIDNDEKTSEKPGISVTAQDLPDPDFSNFETITSCFAVNQVWSLYDSTDGMPRWYARVDRVHDSEFKLWITWIDPALDIKDKSVPVACGIFQDGDSMVVDDHLMFSCQMLHFHQNNKIIIYPRIGEIWAVFRSWDLSWSSSSENRKQPYEYDYVEILSDFEDEAGLGVAYLGKVEGFVSLFNRDEQHGVLQFQIPPSEMLRFSHKVPSFKMTGKEREDVPPGCFELDTAALPKDMFEGDRVGANGKTGRPFSEASKVGMQANTRLESSPSSKKRQKVHDNHSSFSKGSDGRCTNHDRCSVKTRKSVKAVDDVKLRKSPRFSSKINSQATSGESEKTAEKESANKSYGQSDESCISGEKMTAPKKPEKIIKTDSSTIIKAPQDTHQTMGNSKKDGRNDESLSQSKGNVLLSQLNGAKKSSEPETRVPSSSRKTRLENTFNFEDQRSWDKFQIDQIWAIYSGDKGIPRKYAQIKKIDATPEFKLHVAPLEPYRPPELITHPLCCGRFKLKTGIAEVLLPSNFSHQVKAVKGKKNILEVYPGKGEIWALYKNWNTTDPVESDELEIVEITETGEQRVQVVLLTAKGFNKHLYELSQKSEAGFVDIPKMEVSRFSHQIPAFRHLSRATRFGDHECWELDPKAIL